MTSTDWAIHLLLCGGVGMVGQCFRAVGGTKKVNDQASGLNVAFNVMFDWSVFLWSVLRGFMAGVLAGLAIKSDAIDGQTLLGVLAAGYAGTDFVDAFMKKSLPDIQKAAKAAEAVGGAEKLPVVKALGAPAVDVVNAARA